MTNKKSTIHDLYTRNDRIPPHPYLSRQGRGAGNPGGMNPAPTSRLRKTRRRGLILLLLFEGLHALLKLVLRLAELVLLLLQMVVRTAEEGRHILELAVEIVSVLPVPDFDVHQEPLSHLLDLVAEAFDQHAGVAFNLFDPFIYFIEPAVYTLESPVDLLEPLVVPVKLLLNPAKPLIKILNEFLVHTASAATLNSKPSRLSCQ